MVQPQQLVGVERTGRFADGIQSEVFDHLFTSEDFLIAVGPAQTHQIVQQCFWQITVITILHYADRPVTFGQFFTVIAVDHRNVRVNRHRRFQGLKNVDLAWRVVDMVFATDNVGDFHIPVIDNHTEVIGWGTIGTADNKIVQFLVAELDRTTDLIVKNNRTFLRVSKTYNARFIISMMLMAVAAATVITRLLTFRHLLFAQRFQALFRAIAFISSALFQHLIDHRVVAIKTFGLVVRTFIPLQAQPVHAIHNGFDSFRRGTLKIGVFNTQHELTAVVTCKKPGVKSSTRAANVQIACWAWREASFDFHEMALRLERCRQPANPGKIEWAIFYHSRLIPQCSSGFYLTHYCFR